MKSLIGLAVISVTLAAGLASAQNLEQRHNQLQRRLDFDIRGGRVSPRDASHIGNDLDKIARKISHERWEDRGRIDRRDWERLNRDLDKVERRLFEAERYAPRYDRRGGPSGYYERDGYYDRDGYDDRGRRRW
jgi:hypothetical protein